MTKIKPLNYIAALFLCVVLLSVLGVLLGQVKIPLEKIFDEKYLEIIKLRFYRVILAIAVGSGLSVAGVILQSVLRNPLSEPYVLGVSSGAGLGAVIGLIFLSGMISVSLLAFAGGVLTIILVYNLARTGNKLSTENMIISGVVVNALFSSLLMFLISSSGNAKSHSVIWWLLGNLQIFNFTQLVTVVCVICAGILVAIVFAKELNALSLGEEEALHLGVNIERIKKILLLISALITSVAVSVCGIIGFVGLMVPHLTRRIIGPDHRILIIGSAVTGAAFLLLCDIVSRTVMVPQGLPVGVITAFVGVPFFVCILRKTRKAYFQ
ncbi:MAG: iron ABC transporter permease [Candidatus Omnitrophica bacterium]|nr:iron ABC transporter permease [Candidatus Omnitrophota bacterium]